MFVVVLRIVLRLLVISVPGVVVVALMLVSLVIVAFVIGCVLLAPSIILGYGVKAANREDRENGL